MRRPIRLSGYLKHGRFLRMNFNFAAASRRTRARVIRARVIETGAIALFACAAQPGRAIEPSAKLPELDLEMKPHVSAGGGSYVAVTMSLSDPHARAGETLLVMPLDRTGAPSARNPTAIRATDAGGPLPLTREDEPPAQQSGNRYWKATRATVGKVVISYRARPSLARAPDDGTGLRQESGGFIGARFLAMPTAEGPFHVRLRWDLSDAPAGARGVCSLGEGNIETDTPAQALADSYFAVGPLKSAPAQGGGKFGLYWLTDPPFDAAAVGARIQALYARTSAFFGDDSSTYRIFMRENPREGTTGSAFAHSFLLSYGAGENAARAADDLESLLAREMTRSWLALEGEPGDTAWYNDGAAEYYS